jgi:8-oxo-dGTP diphosphatase
VTELGLSITETGDGVAVLDWDRDAAADGGSRAATVLTLAITTVAEEALGSAGLRRLEVSVPSHDHEARRAVLRSGFRLEGRRRSVLPLPDGSWSDEMIFARLSSDQVGGAHGFSSVMNSALPKKRLIAHVLMRDQHGNVLLCQTRFKPDWELPGGIVEPGETPRHGAVREVREELGIDLEVGRLLLVDWLPPYLGWEDAIELIFDGGVVTQAEIERYALQPSEIMKVELVGLERAADLVTPLSHRRLTIATALPPGAMAYTEDGTVPG